jgi:hypothetical protein
VYLVRHVPTYDTCYFIRVGDRVPSSPFFISSTPALGPTEPPIQWVPGAASPGVKQSGLEADHSPPTIADVKKTWVYTSIPLIRLHGVVLN